MEGNAEERKNNPFAFAGGATKEEYSENAADEKPVEEAPSTEEVDKKDEE
jgi:hypothetical protein